MIDNIRRVVMIGARVATLMAPHPGETVYTLTPERKQRWYPAFWWWAERELEDAGVIASRDELTLF